MKYLWNDPNTLQGGNMLYYNRQTNESCNVLASIETTRRLSSMFSKNIELRVKFKNGEVLDIEEGLFKTLYAPSEVNTVKIG